MHGYDEIIINKMEIQWDLITEKGRTRITGKKNNALKSSDIVIMSLGGTC